MIECKLFSVCPKRRSRELEKIGKSRERNRGVVKRRKRGKEERESESDYKLLTNYITPRKHCTETIYGNRARLYIYLFNRRGTFRKF